MQQKRAFLTIDDCPSEKLAEKIDLLTSRSIPAVLFCQGNLLELRPGQAAYAVEKGYILGNHSFDHPRFSELSEARCFEEIERTEALIERIYRKASRRRPARYFRFPYGDNGAPETREAIQLFLREHGFTGPGLGGITYPFWCDNGHSGAADWFWTFDVNEWVFNDRPFTRAELLDHVLSRMEADDPEHGLRVSHQGSNEVILTHDHPGTHGIFRQIIDRLLEKRIEFVEPY
jgi:peptidoglycan/xylan/chitin deacetylase (PgdA/CDA1 family)